MGIKKWSKTANSNDSISSSAGTINWKEGMPPSAVNDSARVTMADVRDWYEDSQWVNLGDADGTTSPRRATNEISLSGTHTTTYHVGRRLKALDASGNLKYGTITATTFSGGTQITLSLDSGSLTGSVSQVWLGALTATNRAIPAQASFLAYNSSDDSNQTGAGAVATVDFDTEVFDQGGNFAADTFTAPIAGRYLLSATVTGQGFGASASSAVLIIATSNRSYRVIKWNPPVTNVSDSLTISVVADMDAADTATVTYQINGMAGNTAAIGGGASPLQTFFSGSFQTT